MGLAHTLDILSSESAASSEWFRTPAKSRGSGGLSREGLGKRTSVASIPSVSRRTTSRTSTFNPSRTFCEVVRLSKMRPFLYQNDFNIKLVILWIHSSYKADFWCFPRVMSGPTGWSSYYSLIFCRLSSPPYKFLVIVAGHVSLFINFGHKNNNLLRWE